MRAHWRSVLTIGRGYDQPADLTRRFIKALTRLSIEVFFGNPTNGAMMADSVTVIYGSTGKGCAAVTLDGGGVQGCLAILGFFGVETTTLSPCSPPAAWPLAWHGVACSPIWRPAPS